MVNYLEVVRTVIAVVKVTLAPKSNVKVNTSVHRRAAPHCMVRVQRAATHCLQTDLGQDNVGQVQNYFVYFVFNLGKCFLFSFLFSLISNFYKVISSLAIHDGC